MRTDPAREDILRVWTPLPSFKAGVNVLRLPFVPLRSSAAPRSYQPALPRGPFTPAFPGILAGPLGRSRPTVLLLLGGERTSVGVAGVWPLGHVASGDLCRFPPRTRDLK